MMIIALILLQGCWVIHGWDIHHENDGYIQGDITPLPLDEILDVKKMIPNDEDYVDITKRSSKLGAQWPRGEVPYEIAANLSSKTKGLIADAIKEFATYTCIRFINKWRRPLATDYVIFQNRGKGSGCNAPIGYSRGRKRTYINLESPGCQHHGTVVHEMCHTIGIHHEQTRIDRDDYVSIIKENVIPGVFEDNFQETPNDRTYWGSFNTKYDYYSIMHYNAYAFSVNGRVTIRTRNPNVQWLIGRMEHLSPIDAEQINEMYNKQCELAGTLKVYKAPPKFQCKDRVERCDLEIKQFTCKKVYPKCCESCRDGPKCKDYDTTCNKKALGGGCKKGHYNYAYVVENCCKTCRDGPKCYKDYDKDCNRDALRGKCKSTHKSYSNMMEYCCKTCKDGPKYLDYDASCTKMVLGGGCKEGHYNHAYVKDNCFKSCRDGPKEYKDYDPDCNRMGLGGGCKEGHSNNAYVKENCFKTCRDGPKCYRDYDRDCNRNALGGACKSTHWLYSQMKEGCCKTCKDGPICKDYASNCKQLRLDGRCNPENYNSYMKKKCCSTCSKGGAVCIDKDIYNCNRYALLGYCKQGHENYKYMMQSCCKSCKDGPVCKDKNTSCNQYADRGYCKRWHRNYKYMVESCCKSCKGK